MRARSLSPFVLGLIIAVGCGTTTDVGGGDAGNNGDAAQNDGATGDGSGGGCNPACLMGRTCCNGQCVNLDNDQLNCGACGTKCTGNTPFCDGTCKDVPCTKEGGTCAGGSGICCGTTCCTSGQICCKDEGPVGGGDSCYTPTAQQPSCPQGCAPMCKSDRNAKRGIEPVDEKAVLDALSHVPMSTWSYKTEDPSVRHLGPMAQDFHAAFELGATDRAYDPIDAHGVAFASIKALYTMVEEQNARIDRLESENAKLRRQAKVCGGD